MSSSMTLYTRATPLTVANEWWGDDTTCVVSYGGSGVMAKIIANYFEVWGYEQPVVVRKCDLVDFHNWLCSQSEKMVSYTQRYQKFPYHYVASFLELWEMNIDWGDMAYWDLLRTFARLVGIENNTEVDFEEIIDAIHWYLYGDDYRLDDLAIDVYYWWVKS